jgi:RHS repeat-associated protein
LTSQPGQTLVYDVWHRLVPIGGMAAALASDGTPLLYAVLAGQVYKDTPVQGQPSWQASTTSIQSVATESGTVDTLYTIGAGGVIDSATAAATPQVQYAYSQTGNVEHATRLASITYPNARVLTYNYTAGYSTVTSLSDASATLESYTYLGVDTVVQRNRPQDGYNLSYGPSGAITVTGDKYGGLDRFGRVFQQLWSIAGGGSSDSFEYGYDADNNVLYKMNIGNRYFDDLYHANGSVAGYDALNQMQAYSRGVLTASISGGTVDTVQTPTDSQAFTQDAVGNLSIVKTNGVSEYRSSNAENETTAVGVNALGYDNAGNLTSPAGQTQVYDAWHRLVRVNNSSNGALIAQYAYDGLGRRMVQIDVGATGAVRSDLYYSSTGQVVEERNNDGVPQAQYVWSPVGSNLLVARDYSTQRNGVLKDTDRLYAQQDANGNVTSLVNTLGQVVERYAYEPFGQVTVLTPSWTALTASTINWQYLYQGGRYDAAAGLYAFGARDYSPSLMRWIEQDPIGFAVGDDNLYRFVGNNPSDFVDPTGLGPEDARIPVPRLTYQCIGGVGTGRSRAAMEEDGRVLSSIITRGAGLGQAAFGGLELAGAAATAPTPAVVAAAPLLLVLGLDNLYAGLRQAITGQTSRSVAAQFLQLQLAPNGFLAQFH